METGDLKAAWQSQLSGRRLVLDEAVILRQVVRGQDEFRGMIFWRDVREVGVALFMTGFFVYHYCQSPDIHAWPLLLLAASMAWIAGFLLVTRIRHGRRYPPREDSVKACAESTLAETNRQIWLLKNVLWWYILPPIAAGEFGFVYFAIVVFEDPWTFWKLQPFTLGIALGVYLLNRWAVRAYLEPRRQETESLLKNLQSNE
jgi:hypothetical protein